MTAQHEIIAGPSREELFDALRLRYEGREVTFTVTSQTRTFTPATVKPRNLILRVQVNEIGIEDGSGDNWLFKLYDRNAVLGSQYLKGYINTKRRNGWMRLTTK